MSPRRRALGLPLLHFLALGGLLFAGSRLLEDAPAPAPLAAPEAAVAVGARGLPSPGAPDGRTTPAAGALDARELLFRAALELGFHRSDPIVRRRLARDMRFLDPEDDRSDDALVKEALELGLHHGDVVVRRRLVQKMELLAWARADARAPSQAELRAAYDRDPERYRRPARVRITHVYLSRDRRGEVLATDARRLGPRLAGMDPEDAPALGDPFLLDAHLPLLDEAGLANRLGPALAREALAAPPRTWSGPVASAYGMHWLWVHEREPARLPPFEEVRDDVREHLRLERRERAVRALVETLRAESPAPRAGS